MPPQPPHFLDGQPHGHTDRPKRRRTPGSRCASASAGRSARARRRWSPRCAGNCVTSCRWPCSPTTSTPQKTPTSCAVTPSCPTAASPRCRPAAAPHRDPRRHHRQPRRDRRSHRGQRAARPDPGGIRWRQPDGHLLVRAGGRSDLRHRCRRRRQSSRKGGPGVTYSDLLVVNKTDLAPLVGADLDVMRRDAATVRGDRPAVLISLTEDPPRPPCSRGCASS